jgi:hypothetical protein
VSPERTRQLERVWNSVQRPILGPNNMEMEAVTPVSYEEFHNYIFFSLKVGWV